MKAQFGLPTGGQFAITVENNQLMPGVRAVIASACRLVMLETEGEAFFSEKAANKVEIGFAILRCDTVGAQGLGDLASPVCLGVVGEYLANDVDNRLVLKKVAIPPLGKEGQKRLHDQPVAGQTAIGAQLHGLG